MDKSLSRKMTTYIVAQGTCLLVAGIALALEALVVSFFAIIMASIGLVHISLEAGCEHDVERKEEN